MKKQNETWREYRERTGKRYDTIDQKQDGNARTKPTYPFARPDALKSQLTPAAQAIVDANKA